MKGRAPGGKVKGGGEKGGNASLPGDSRVSRRANSEPGWVSSADCDADVSIFPVEALTSQLGLLSIQPPSKPGQSRGAAFSLQGRRAACAKVFF
eukprot:scaffold6880_cov110-Isochrysis_galbana.AAC.4